MSNQIVSVEEVRAKRPAKEQESPENVDKQELTSISDTSSVEPLETQQTDASTDVQSIGEVAPEPAPAPSPVPAIPIPNLEAFLASATPEQLVKLRVLAASKGLTGPSIGSPVRAADGSMTIPVHLAPEIVEQLEMWAESDGVTLVEEAQTRVNDALTNYLYGDWSATIMKPAEVIPPTTTTTTTVPAAATK